MLRPLHGIVLAAGLAVLVGCGPGEDGQEQSEVVTDSSEQMVAPGPPVEIPGAAHSFPVDGEINDGTSPPRRYRLLDCANPAQPKGWKQEVGAGGTPGNNPISTPGRAHQLHVAKGVVPSKAEYEFAIQEVTNTDGGCQTVVTQLSGAPIDQPGAFTLRIRCDRPGSTGCLAEMMIRLDDSTVVQDTRIETIGNGTYWVADLARLSTYALASPEGFDQ